MYDFDVIAPVSPATIVYSYVIVSPSACFADNTTSLSPTFIVSFGAFAVVNAPLFASAYTFSLYFAFIVILSPTFLAPGLPSTFILCNSGSTVSAVIFIPVFGLFSVSNFVVPLSYTVPV